MTKFKIGDIVVERSGGSRKPTYTVYKVKDIDFKEIKNIAEEGSLLYVRRYAMEDIWKFNADDNNIVRGNKLKTQLFTDVIDNKCKESGEGFFHYVQFPEISEIDQSKVYMLNDNFKMKHFPTPLCTVISVGEETVKVRWLTGSNSISLHTIRIFKKMFTEYVEDESNN
jgi:hypothetical protein